MIQLENVSKAYGGVPVLARISFALGAGDTVKLSGASGAGKTTLLRILMGLERADGGRVVRERHLRFSAVFQEDRLCPWLSALENVQLVCTPEDMPQARDALLELLPANSLAKHPAALSGGMRRRVAIVRAVLSRSDCLVLDEPFAGLDAESAAHAAAFVQQRRNGRALIYASHGALSFAEAEQTILL